MAVNVSHLILISLDGLASVDLAYLRDLPHFKTMLESGTLCAEVRGVYPTHTYPLHASMITGTYPQKHGIFANTPLQPGVEKPSWFWYRKDIRVPTLYDIARRAGFKVASLFWPSAGRARLNWNIPEIIAVRPGQSQVGLVLRNGTPLFILNMKRRFGHLLQGSDREQLDNFNTEAAAWLIRNKRPGLLLLHLLDLDHTKHIHGFQGEAINRVLRQADGRLGRLFEASRRAGTFEETAFVVIGDHAYFDVHRRIHLNYAFKNAGLIRLDRMNKLVDWQASCNPCGGSAQVFLKDRYDQALYEKVETLLLRLKGCRQNGIEAVYDRDALKGWRQDESVDYMLEAVPGYTFCNGRADALVTPIEDDQKANHGYRPDREGYSSLFLASGAGIRRGVLLESMDIVDVGPSLAALLGLSLEEAQGTVRSEILNTE